MMTMGTLHSLPSPVTRRGQKNYKPEYFETLTKTKDAMHAVADIKMWLESGLSDAPHATWPRQLIISELGTVLRAAEGRNLCTSQQLYYHFETPDFSSR